MGECIVAVTDNRHASYDIEREILKQAGIELAVLDCETEDDVIRKCADMDGLLLDMAPMSARVVQALRRCRVINRYGVGYDNVDVEACTRKGIWVTNVPDYCAEDVSDHAVALLLSCLRQTALRDRLVRAGQWNVHGQTSYRVCGKTLGVLGAGRIARALIRKMQGFALKEVLVYDPYVDAASIATLRARKCGLDELLAASDFVSLHMPVTPETRGMINRQTLRLMKPSAILINTGRGPLVDDPALIDALQSHKIAGAGLDTHTVEPLPANSPYLVMDSVVLTDHTAYNTAEAVEELKTKSARNIVAALGGKTPPYHVNTPAK